MKAIAAVATSVLELRRGVAATEDTDRGRAYICVCCIYIYRYWLREILSREISGRFCDEIEREKGER